MVTFALRLVSMMVLARLVLKEDFGLVNMVTPFTGFLSLFRDGGLSMATVQQKSITRAQASTMFWINLAFGVSLWILTALSAPFLATFYKEPKLFWVTVALGTSFVFNGVSTQHRAMISRKMQITALSAIDIVSLVSSIAVAIVLAAKSFGYASLVAMTTTQAAVGAAGVWIWARWIPGRPARSSGVWSMLSYGGAITLNNVVVYLAYNADKVLLGRFFGAEQLGIYGRAYQLINIPSDNLSQAMGSVAFPALSRVQEDAERLKRYFLGGYRLLLSLAIPLTAACALFADDMIRVFLGPGWQDAAAVFRLLAPTVLALALMNPFGWLILANGRAARNLAIALMIAPVVFLGYLAGLKAGPQGVALGYSLAMTVLIIPVLIWSMRDTAITAWDIVKVLSPLAGATALGAASTFLVHGWVRNISMPFVRLVAECAIFFGVYAAALLFLLGQWPVYSQVLHDSGLWRRAPRSVVKTA